jgi:DNA-binding transcriptional regulator PaaX
VSIKDRDLIVNFLSKNKISTAKQIMAGTGIDERDCRTGIAKLLAQEKIRRSYSGREVFFELDWLPIKMKMINTMFKVSDERASA